MWEALDRHGLNAQGDFAQQVREEYERSAGSRLLSDLNALGDDAYGIVEIFTFSSGSLMGNLSDHTHPVEPRHVRRFVSYVQNALGGGPWDAVLR